MPSLTSICNQPCVRRFVRAPRRLLDPCRAASYAGRMSTPDRSSVPDYPGAAASRRARLRRRRRGPGHRTADRACPRPGGGARRVRRRRARPCGRGRQRGGWHGLGRRRPGACAVERLVAEAGRPPRPPRWPRRHRRGSTLRSVPRLHRRGLGLDVRDGPPPRLPDGAARRKRHGGSRRRDGLRGVGEGLTSAPRHAAYGAAKAGLMSLVRTVAVELGPLGIRANAVAPGAVWDAPCRRAPRRGRQGSQHRQRSAPADRTSRRCRERDPVSRLGPVVLHHRPDPRGRRWRQRQVPYPSGA